MAKISVIVPIYNSARLLNKCLDSLAKQTFDDFEVLMIDDGSTDNSLEICQRYVAKDSRFRFFHQKHQGQSAARNYALKLATGDRISFVDSDDYVEAVYLQNLNEQMDKNNSDIATAPYFRLDISKDEYFFLAANNINPADYEKSFDSTDWLMHRDLWEILLGVFITTVCGKLFKKKIIR